MTQDQIALFAIRTQTIELNIRREYFQHLLLSYFYQDPKTSGIYFKGGTALRILYNSPRFSEDLDFTSSLYEIKELENILLQTLAQIEKEGVTVTLEESKETSGGYLTNLTFNALEKSVLIQLQISFRPGENRGELLSIASDFIPAYTVNALALDLLIDEKMRALLSRKKPRDFYDLYFILRKNLLPPTKKGILPEALKALETTDINFETELKQFLPKSQWAIIRDFKTTLEREINRFI